MTEDVDRPGNAPSPSSAAVVVLAELAEALIADLPNHRSGKTARSVTSGSVLRAVVIALAEGADMQEHDAPPAATLHVIRGEVTLSTRAQTWTIRSGELITVPRQRYSVHAHSDSAFLLTVALR
jgi:quercetin dioxygenase-like cupin family protein